MSNFTKWVYMMIDRILIKTALNVNVMSKKLTELTEKLKESVAANIIFSRKIYYCYLSSYMMLKNDIDIKKDPKTYVSPLSTQTVNTNRQKPTNRSPHRELNLQTNQTKSQISIASNIETCSNQLLPKKRGRKRLPRDENVLRLLLV
ncbi:hypothetical protein BpHYR1_034136 [Brachionus plicatilis]|uniref:Uncharacterized protein n=1 Tax=Brachionus plicatilis TaxID=10195 RepID=A0A3M7S662_BRAPC|nr:hypothetical protein BpHYR1_034136 [Brachionus plicatilis]